MHQRTDTVGGGSISRGMQFALFVLAMVWAAAANLVASRASQGIAIRFRLGAVEPVLQSIFLLFLLVIGLRAVDSLATRGRFAGDTLPLPRRATRGAEWLTGAAIGWLLCLVAVLPLLLSLNLHARLVWWPGSTTGLLTALVSLLLGTLVEEVIFRGYGFQRLIGAFGQATAAVLMSAIFAAVLVWENPPREPFWALVDCTLLGLLLAMAWLRTHGLWLGWGIHFGYRVVAAVMLGLPVAGRGVYGSPTEMFVSGPRWLGSGSVGLDGAAFTSLALLGAMALLYRESRDWAWHYTFQPLVPAGYEVVVAPPAAHTAMEQQATAAAAPVLVQILPSTPQGITVQAPPADAETPIRVSLGELPPDETD